MGSMIWRLSNRNKERRNLKEVLKGIHITTEEGEGLIWLNFHIHEGAQETRHSPSGEYLQYLLLHDLFISIFH